MKVVHPKLQRDLNLIRLLLLRYAGYDVEKVLEPFPKERRGFNIALMEEAGFVHAITQTDASGFPVGGQILRLTWNGFEFLQLIKDAELWERAKTVFTDESPWSMGPLIEWLQNESRNYYRPASS